MQKINFSLGINRRSLNCKIWFVAREGLKGRFKNNAIKLRHNPVLISNPVLTQSILMPSERKEREDSARGWMTRARGSEKEFRWITSIS